MTDNLQSLPESKRQLLDQLVAQLSAVKGMASIVLGGSYASGSHTPHSDLDIGLYYFESSPFSINEVRCIAEAASASGAVTVTDYYGWGAWVNGGAWIHTPQGKVDFIYRNVEQVRRTIADAHQGIYHHDYDQQPAHGFYSVIYLAETRICIPLFDPQGLIADLKRSVEIYPPRLKEKIIADSLWAAEFTFIQARGFAAQGDVYNTAACLTRASASLTQALFALNEKYFLRDKNVMNEIADFSIFPPGYVDQVNSILACPGGTSLELEKSVGELEVIWRSVVSLAGNYRPQFKL
jgi:hypothetical protein